MSEPEATTIVRLFKEPAKQTRYRCPHCQYPLRVEVVTVKPKTKEEPKS